MAETDNTKTKIFIEAQLEIEGRLSKIKAQFMGRATPEEIEKIFYRAFARLCGGRAMSKTKNTLQSAYSSW